MNMDSWEEAHYNEVVTSRDKRVEELEEALREIQHSLVGYDEGGPLDAYEIARDVLEEGNV